MANINHVAISGNLTRDPELRSTAGGKEVLSFGVAVNDSRKDPQTGEWKDCPNFIDCTMFGKRAGSVSQYLTKGTKVSIEGKLRWSQWDTKDGSKRSKLEVIVNELEFMNRRDDSKPAYSAQPAPMPMSQQSTPQTAPQQAYPQAYQQPAPMPVQQPMAQPQAMPAQQPAQYAQQPQQAIYDEDIPF